MTNTNIANPAKNPTPVADATRPPQEGREKAGVGTSEPMRSEKASPL